LYFYENEILHSEQVIDSASCGLNFIPNHNYYIEKANIEKIRTQLNQQYTMAATPERKSALLDSAMLLFSHYLLNAIIPHWYGTRWDFNGYTSKPNQGSIACGYFVSTTMRDMGLNLNRYKLAQQAPLNEAKSIAIDPGYVQHLTQDNSIEQIELLNNGLYFIGLNNHVGFLFLSNKVAYFIHSNYIDGHVMIEKAERSEAFISNEYFLVNISINQEMAKKWLNKESIRVFNE